MTWHQLKCMSRTLIYRAGTLGALCICHNWQVRPVSLLTECTNLKDKFYASHASFFKIAPTIFGEIIFFKILQHHPFKMTHSINRLAGLGRQFWQKESTLGLPCFQLHIGKTNLV